MKSLCTSFKVLTPTHPSQSFWSTSSTIRIIGPCSYKTFKSHKHTCSKFKTSINFIVPPAVMWGLWFAVSYIGPPCSFSYKLGIPRTHSNQVPQEVIRSEEYICLTINSDWNWRTNRNSLMNEIMYLKKYRY